MGKLKSASMPILGMTCTNCAANIERSLRKLPGVSEACVDFASEKLAVQFDPSRVNEKEIIARVERAGYAIATCKTELMIIGLKDAVDAVNLENALSRQEGVISASVSSVSGRASFEFIAGMTGIGELAAAIKKAGFGLVQPGEDADFEDVEDRAVAGEIRRQKWWSIFGLGPRIAALIGALTVLVGVPMLVMSGEMVLPGANYGTMPPFLMMLMTISNGITALSYASIPVVLAVFVRRRKDLPYPWVFTLFALFILACGATHVMHTIGLWMPVDAWQAGVDTFCALVSLTTAVLLWPLLPQFMAIPSPQQLRQVNHELTREKAALERAQNELRAAYEDVEQRIDERTADLGQANQYLQEEIKERIRAEEQIREKTSELDRIFTLSLDLLCIASAEGRFIKLNPAWEQTLGYPIEELEGQNFLDMVHPDDYQSTVDAMSALSEGRDVLDFTNRYRCRDGTYRWIEWCSKPYQNGVIYAAARDVTERRQNEEKIRELNASLEQRVQERTAQLLAANQELESFSYSVSHDLRAPLRSIDGFSQVLQEEYIDSLDDTARDYFNRIRNSTHHMADLIDDLLRLSRVTRSEMKLTEMDLCPMALKILDAFRGAEAERRVELVLPEKLIVLADANLMEIALDNLLRNAWKFTSKSATARIEMGSFEKNGKKVIFIRDNGAGFDMAYVDRLFLSFERLHSSQDYEGSGIGLAMIKRIIQRHGGSVWAEGEVGKGATFFMELP